ncbi:VIT and VWA domain-containing protein, partial [bacterium]
MKNEKHKITFHGILLLLVFSAAVSLALICTCRAHAEAGVLIPISKKNEPDPKILALDKMEVQIEIDNQHAHVKVLQIFENKTDSILEGKYVFQIPSKASISDFAIWDSGVRIPGVIMEKSRAKALYEEIKRQQIDPGLLHQSDDREERNAFVCKVVPIPRYGTKRLELEYTQTLSMGSLRSFFSFPLKPDMYREQSAGNVKIILKMKSGFPVRDFKLHSSSMPLKYINTPNLVDAVFEAKNFTFTENFEFEYAADVEDVFMNFLAYRKTDLSDEPVPLFVKEIRRRDMDGYFFTSAIFNIGGEGVGGQESGDEAPVTVVILLDTSLSMRWEKLDKAYEALKYFLTRLSDGDRFRLILFNDGVNAFGDGLVNATDDNAGRALEFVKSQYLTGGTELLGGFRAAMDTVEMQNTGSDRVYIVAITDGHPTMGAIKYKELNEQVNASNKKNTPVFIFGIGNDTNMPLLEETVKPSEGYFTWAKETEDLDFKLKTFFGMIGQKMVRNIGLTVDETVKPNRVYPAEEQKAYNGTSVVYVGRYSTPTPGVKVTLKGTYEGENIERSTAADFPAESIEHPHLGRLWARARVDYLLKLIEYEGEKEEWIDEIIELSKQYTFVTPYTAFLAAPRSLLRPRVIKPGDPVLKVKTDESIVSVTAIFPFNLTKNMNYIDEEDVWETRFLAPVWMNDGKYKCTLILRDRDGNIYRENKSFIIDSRPPSPTVHLDRKKYGPGDEVRIIVYSDNDTRRITASLLHLPPVDVTWNPAEKACVGILPLPDNLPGG